jgi:hypothetical protein
MLHTCTLFTKYLILALIYMLVLFCFFFFIRKHYNQQFLTISEQSVIPQREGDSSDPPTQFGSLSHVHSVGMQVPLPQWNSFDLHNVPLPELLVKLKTRS